VITSIKHYLHLLNIEVSKSQQHTAADVFFCVENKYELLTQNDS